MKNVQSAVIEECSDCGNEILALPDDDGNLHDGQYAQCVGCKIEGSVCVDNEEDTVSFSYRYWK